LVREVGDSQNAAPQFGSTRAQTTTLFRDRHARLDKGLPASLHDSRAMGRSIQLFVRSGIAQLECESCCHTTRADAHGSEAWKGSTMTNFKLLSAAAILSTVILTPAIAQQAVDEPGLQAFYQSLGVGSHDSPTASAMASARGSYASAPAKRISTKKHASSHKG
jgi:hypothetical protein